nr:glycosyltransferase [Desulfopila inferna]
MVLDFGNIDFLIVESSWQTVTGHWYLGQYVHSQHKQELLEIIAYAQKKSIPAIYWNTQSHLYHSHYSAFAENFDVVFCADAKEAELMNQDGLKTEVLLPAVQPAIHNRFTEFQPDHPKFSINVLYDGFTDIYRLHDKLEILHEIVPYGLKIIESQAEIFKTKIKDIPLLEKHFLGTIQYNDLINLLKHTETAITTETTLRTETLQQWQTLETAACRVPVLHRGILDEQDIRHGLISHFEHDDDLLLMLESFHQDDLYRQRIGHLQWRCIYQQHTFSHRVAKICSLLNITHNYDEYPAISIVTPTSREDKISSSVETFTKQKYPNKELILVVNNNNPDMLSISQSINSNNIRILPVPEEKFAGAALNIGNTVAKGAYYFRMDEDAYYGEHYIADALLHLKSVDAKLFRALFNCVYLEEKDQIVKWNKHCPSLVFASSEFYEENFSNADNTFTCHAVFSDEGYQDNNSGSTNSSLYRNIQDKMDYYIILGNFNMVSKNVSGPTWHLPNLAVMDMLSPSNGVNLRDLFV